MDAQALRDVMSKCGEIKGIRLATDRDTGRFKGFGHVEFVEGEKEGGQERQRDKTETEWKGETETDRDRTETERTECSCRCVCDVFMHFHVC